MAIWLPLGLCDAIQIATLNAKVAEPSGWVLRPLNEEELWAVTEKALQLHRTGEQLKISDNYAHTTFKPHPSIISHRFPHGIPSLLNSFV